MTHISDKPRVMFYILTLKSESKHGTINLFFSFDLRKSLFNIPGLFVCLHMSVSPFCGSSCTWYVKQEDRIHTNVNELCVFHGNNNSMLNIVTKPRFMYYLIMILQSVLNCWMHEMIGEKKHAYNGTDGSVLKMACTTDNWAFNYIEENICTKSYWNNYLLHLYLKLFSSETHIWIWKLILYVCVQIFWCKPCTKGTSTQ